MAGEEKAAKLPDMTKTISFRGVDVVYDSREIHLWRTQRAIASSEHDPYGGYEAIDRILCGRADEVADAVGGTDADMSALLAAITEAENAKN